MHPINEEEDAILRRIQKDLRIYNELRALRAALFREESSF